MIIVSINISYKTKKMAQLGKSWQTWGWVDISNTHIKYLAQWHASETPREAGTVGPFRLCWPASGAELVRYRFNERPCLQRQDREWAKIFDINDTCTCTSTGNVYACTHIHTYTCCFFLTSLLCLLSYWIWFQPNLKYLKCGMSVVWIRTERKKKTIWF